MELHLDLIIAVNLKCELIRNKLRTFLLQMNSSLPAAEPTCEYDNKVKTEPHNSPASLEENGVQGTYLNK